MCITHVKIQYLQGSSHELSADFLTKTFQSRKEWHEIFKLITNKDLQPRLLYPARLSFKIEGEIKSFPDKRKLKESVTTKPVLQEILKVLL